jgi:integrase/recombinase XerD
LEKKGTLTQRHEKGNERSKVILGLMIWQGVHSGELKKMETTHVQLNEGIVYIPGTTRSNGRELKLSVAQIIPLHAYINSLPQTQTKLFDCNAYNIVARITEELKGINPIIKNAQHIRASVIFHWLKMYDKRQVQYMIGHKWISSTERYEQQNLDSLTDLLMKHHPFS